MIKVATSLMGSTRDADELRVRVAELEKANAWLLERNATLEGIVTQLQQIVTQRAQSNATRQKVYRDRRKAK